MKENSVCADAQTVLHAAWAQTNSLEADIQTSLLDRQTSDLAANAQSSLLKTGKQTDSLSADVKANLMQIYRLNLS